MIASSRRRSNCRSRWGGVFREPRGYARDGSSVLNLYVTYHLHAARAIASGTRTLNASVPLRLVAFNILP